MASLKCLVCLLSVVVAGEMPASRPAAIELDLRVVTFNIRYGTANDGPNHWTKRQDLVFDVLRRHSPDAVGLQEALRFQIDEIRKTLPQYGEVGAGRDDGREQGEYSAILYLTDRFDVDDHGTFWLSDTPDVPGSRSWGNTIPRVCTWARLIDRQTRGAFYVYNTHLDHIAQGARERGVELIARHMAGRKNADPMLWTGDFNAGEDNAVIQYVLGRITGVPARKNGCAVPPVFVDTFRVLHPKAAEAGTFNAFLGQRTGTKIDYILAPPSARVLEADIIHDNTDGRYPSDHFPIGAQIILPVSRHDMSSAAE